MAGLSLEDEGVLKAIMFIVDGCRELVRAGEISWAGLSVRLATVCTFIDAYNATQGIKTQYALNPQVIREKIIENFNMSDEEEIIKDEAVDDDILTMLDDIQKKVLGDPEF